MHYTEIAIAKPFEGAPKINMCDHYGASPGKPILLKGAKTVQKAGAAAAAAFMRRPVR